jgi:hypothetical protein
MTFRNHNSPSRLRELAAIATLTFSALTRLAADAEPAGVLAARLPLLGQLPLRFEPRETDGGPIRFISRGPAYHLAISPTETLVSLRRLNSPGTRVRRPEAGEPRAASMSYRNLRLEFVGADPSARVTGEGELPGLANYFIGHDPARWRTGVPTFARVRVTGLYPGISLLHYGNQRWLEYDFEVSPGADPEAIAIRFSGADQVRVDARGDLVLTLGADEIRHPKPLIHQTVRGTRREISGGYRLTEQNTVKFQIGDYDPRLPLVIDPVLSYAKLLGGSGADVLWAVAIAPDGSVCVAGETMSAQMATAGAFQTNLAGTTALHGDALVARVNNDFTAFLYTTYLGGGTDDAALALAVDGAGNAIVTGYSDSTNFPTQSALFTNLAGVLNPLGRFPHDAFITKIGPYGSNLVFSTFMGGGEVDQGIGIAIDAATNIFVAGYTLSTNFPTTNAAFAGYGGNGDAFALKLDPAGASLLYSMYLGGTNLDVGDDVAADAAGNAFVIGYTASTNFPVTNAVQSLLNNTTNFSFGYDAFATKIPPGGGAPVYSTFLGGANNDFGFRLALDAAGAVHVTGSTRSGDFPRTATNLNAVVVTNSLAEDAFVLRLSAAGTNLDYSAVLGGDGKDEGWDVAVDAAGRACVIGATTSLNFPTNGLFGSLRGTNSGFSDAFVAQLDTNGAALVFSGYLGGGGSDLGYGIALDAAGNACLVGETASTDFPSAPVGAVLSGPKDAFIAKIAADPALAIATAGTNAQVSWPAFSPEFTLQSSSGLSSGGWTGVAVPVIVTNGRHTVTLPATNAQQFFRLRNP